MCLYERPRIRRSIRKDRRDQNHGRCGFVSGNPRYGKSHSGGFKAERAADRQTVRRLVVEVEGTSVEPMTEEEMEYYMFHFFLNH